MFRHKGVPVKSLMTWGGQHQGIVNVPGCTIFDDTDKPNFLCTVTCRYLSALQLLFQWLAPVATAMCMLLLRSIQKCCFMYGWNSIGHYGSESMCIVALQPSLSCNEVKSELPSIH
jgi:hypothetical protein